MKALLQSLFGELHGNIIYVLLDATQYTIYLSLIAFIGGSAIGVVITFCRLFPKTWFGKTATAYVWLFQSIPLLMLLFITGLGIPVFFQITVTPMFAATVSLTLFTSAYLSEVWRGALESVQPGQWQAGRALGLNFSRTLQKIIAPQAIRISTPPTVGFLVQVIKGTSLAYIIDFSDLMRWGKKIANSQLEGAEPFIIYPLVALIYFCLCFPLSMLSRRLERSMLREKGMQPSSSTSLLQGA